MVQSILGPRMTEVKSLYICWLFLDSNYHRKASWSNNVVIVVRCHHHHHHHQTDLVNIQQRPYTQCVVFHVLHQALQVAVNTTRWKLSVTKGHYIICKCNASSIFGSTYSSYTGRLNDCKPHSHSQTKPREGTAPINTSVLPSFSQYR